MKPLEVTIPSPGQQARSEPIACKPGDKLTASVFIPSPEGLEKNIFANLEVRSRGAFLSLDNAPGFIAAKGAPVTADFSFTVPLQTDAVRLQVFTQLEAGEWKPAKATLAIK